MCNPRSLRTSESEKHQLRWDSQSDLTKDLADKPVTTVHFYTIPDSDESSKLRFACRLASESFYNGDRIHIYTRDAEQAHAVDDCLWGYPVDRFVPHDIFVADSNESFVNIGYDDYSPGRGEMLINLTDDVPSFVEEFITVREIVLSTEKLAGRDRYSRYAAIGCTLHYTDLHNWEDETILEL